MQRQLLLIAEKIPDDIMLTLLKCFAKISSREPEPKPKIPFLRAFAKISEDNSIKPGSPFRDRDYESGNSEAENDCSFSYKMSTTTEEISFPTQSEEQSGTEMAETSDAEAGQALENIDEGIEVEMPKLLEPPEEFADLDEPQASENVEVQFDDIVEGEAIADGEIIADSEEQQISAETEAIVEEPIEEPIEEVVIDYEPVPTEPPTVSLDDIEREIQEMQTFLLYKGVKPEKTKKPEENEKQQEAEQVIEQPKDVRDIEDAFKVDVCIKLKSRHGDSHKHHKKHHHSKYLSSEDYREIITNEGPIIDPTIPNTTEDFMKVKSMPEKMSKKKQKIQALDVSWQNLCENQKRLYK